MWCHSNILYEEEQFNEYFKSFPHDHYEFYRLLIVKDVRIWIWLDYLAITYFKDQIMNIIQ